MAGFETASPPRKNRGDPPPNEEDAYRKHGNLERLDSGGKQMATRYDNLGIAFVAMAHIARIASTLRRIIEPGHIRRQALAVRAARKRSHAFSYFDSSR